jgi:hypothetical protein
MLFRLGGKHKNFDGGNRPRVREAYSCAFVYRGVFMKKNRFLFGMLAVMLVFGSVLIACDDGSGGKPALLAGNATADQALANGNFPAGPLCQNRRTGIF